MDDFITITLTDTHLHRLHASPKTPTAALPPPKTATIPTTGMRGKRPTASPPASSSPFRHSPALAYDDWRDAYRPVLNTLRRHAPFDGLMFETFGPELDAVASADPACVWTIVDGEDESLWLLSGCHFINRLGYFITERPWAGAEPVEIALD
jgi:hypothetical protein